MGLSQWQPTKLLKYGPHNTEDRLQNVMLNPVFNTVIREKCFPGCILLFAWWTLQNWVVHCVFVHCDKLPSLCLILSVFFAHCLAVCVCVCVFSFCPSLFAEAVPCRSPCRSRSVHYDNVSAAAPHLPGAEKVFFCSASRKVNAANCLYVKQRFLTADPDPVSWPCLCIRGTYAWSWVCSQYKQSSSECKCESYSVVCGSLVNAVHAEWMPDIIMNVTWAVFLYSSHLFGGHGQYTPSVTLAPSHSLTVRQSARSSRFTRYKSTKLGLLKNKTILLLWLIVFLHFPVLIVMSFASTFLCSKNNMKA